jgi:hypothetical protein
VVLTEGDRREKDGGITATSTSSRAAPERDRALPSEGELEAFAAALGGDAGVLGMQMGRKTGERGGLGAI